MNIILASTSPRRKELLGNLGLEFQIINPDVLENSNLALPQEYVMDHASIKANAINLSDSLVIAADTIVWCEGKILEKPRDSEDAKQILQSLSGRVHQVYTGVCCRYQNKEICFFEMTEVEFYPLSLEFIKKYIATGEPMDKAGAYGIQGLGQIMVRKIKGNYANVMGLPTSKLAKELKHWLGSQSPI